MILYAMIPRRSLWYHEDTQNQILKYKIQNKACYHSMILLWYHAQNQKNKKKTMLSNVLITHKFKK